MGIEGRAGEGTKNRNRETIQGVVTEILPSDNWLGSEIGFLAGLHMGWE